MGLCWGKRMGKGIKGRIKGGGIGRGGMEMGNVWMRSWGG